MHLTEAIFIGKFDFDFESYAVMLGPALMAFLDLNLDHDLDLDFQIEMCEEKD